MHASARIHHPSVCFDSVPTSHLVVSVTGDEGDRIRPNLGLVFVIDRSGSMAGPKLETVVESLRYLSSYLTSNDTVALVTFDNVVRVDLGSTETSPEGLATLSATLSQVSPGGWTALDAGLEAGLSLAEQMVRDNPNRVVRVILLTDGCANVGQVDPGLIVGRLANSHESVSLSTIGVGLDCNHNLLGQLAERGGGSYGFVESAAQASEVLGAEIGGLVNLDASRVQVTVTTKGTYLELNDPLAIVSRRDDDSVVVSLGNLVAGQTRNLVFPVTLSPPRRPHARPVTVADVAVCGRVEELDVTLDLKPKVHFVAGATVRDEELDEVVDLAVLAQAQHDAELAASRLDFQSAKESLSGLVFNTPAAEVLLTNLATGYDTAKEYSSSQVMRNSMGAMLSPSTDLVGSSAAFNSLTSRTVGTYTTSAARDVALDTASNVSATLTRRSSQAHQPLLGGNGQPANPSERTMPGLVISSTAAGTGLGSPNSFGGATGEPPVGSEMSSTGNPPPDMTNSGGTAVPNPAFTTPPIVLPADGTDSPPPVNSNEPGDSEE